MKGHDEEKRRRILRAAEELLSTRSSHEVKLDEVSELAGVGKGTIYLYFKDKEALFLEVALSGFDELCGLVRRAGAAVNGDFHRHLLEVCGAVGTFFEDRAALLRVMQTGQHYCREFPPGLRKRWLARRRELVRAIGAVIGAGQKQGELRGDIPAEVLADFLLGMLRTRTRDLGDAPPAFRTEAFVVELFCHGAAGLAREGERGGENRGFVWTES